MQTMKSKSRSFRDLEARKLSIKLAKELYSLTEKFTSSENFGLTNQIRRAAVFIPSNIAEGQDRNSAKEFGHFLAISSGSTSEVRNPTDNCKRIRIVDPGGFKSPTGQP